MSLPLALSCASRPNPVAAIGCRNAPHPRLLLGAFAPRESQLRHCRRARTLCLPCPRSSLSAQITY